MQVDAALAPEPEVKTGARRATLMDLVYDAGQAFSADPLPDREQGPRSSSCQKREIEPVRATQLKRFVPLGRNPVVGRFGVRRAGQGRQGEDAKSHQHRSDRAPSHEAGQPDGCSGRERP